MLRVYFVRHAQSEHPWGEDRTRPLSVEGKDDAKQVLEFFKDKQIDEFYSSPYRRSVDTIKEAAEFFRQEIKLVEGFRERENGLAANTLTMIEKRWRDLNFHEDQGESISMVQKRNMAALKRILASLEDESLEKDLNIVI